MRASSLIALSGLFLAESALAGGPPAGALSWPARIDLERRGDFNGALGDVTGDGIPDYVWADDGIDHVRRGTGDGALGADDCVLPVDGWVLDRHVADLDGDPYPDLLVSRTGVPRPRREPLGREDVQGARQRHVRRAGHLRRRWTLRVAPSGPRVRHGLRRRRPSGSGAPA